MDARVEGQYSLKDALKVANLAVQCISPEPRFRPKMEEVVKALEQLLESNDNEGSRGSRHESLRKVNRNSNNGPRYHRKSTAETCDGKAASYPRPSASPLRT